MENDINEMMPKGVKSPDGIIECMGNPGKGVPVAVVKMEESPFEEGNIK
jgi:hypothetical protein